MTIEKNYITKATTLLDLLDRLNDAIAFIGQGAHWFIDWNQNICLYSADGKILFQIEPNINHECPTELTIEETNKKNGGNQK